MSKINEHVDKLLQELRRGTITIGALSQLYEPQYGYSLVTTLKEKGVQVEPGTLYPLLRRLEKQGLLESQWDTSETRPRKYYLLSQTGKEVLDLLRVEWQNIARSMNVLMEEETNEDGDD
ncbi:PadR family transcriptional regulator [Piscibacillus halophilus]|uniref:PadR family transcriptional regulator n=1 Tax=Piscibacillus halophilus TaxID=571933 RepID=UPI001589CACA|nr:PadR family transcriptional regulator [Piscibacillus halophilus]